MFFAMARFRETKRNFPTTWFLLGDTWRLRQIEIAMPCPQQAQQPQLIPLTYSPPCLQLRKPVNFRRP